MRHTKKFFRGAILCLLSGLLAATASAANVRIPDGPPQSVEAIMSTIGRVQDYIDTNAMCGGWNLSESVGNVPGEGVSAVTGVPGRDGLQMKEDPATGGFTPYMSGMAHRVEKGGFYDDGFQFPETAEGLRTACDRETEYVTRRVWRDGENGDPSGYVFIQVPNPYFENPPCAFDNGGQDGGPQTPNRCMRFCGWLNTFMYEDCQIFQLNEDGNGWHCVATAQKYTCTEEWATKAVMPPQEEFSSSRSSPSGDNSSSVEDSSQPGDGESSEPGDDGSGGDSSKPPPDDGGSSSLDNPIEEPQKPLRPFIPIPTDPTPLTGLENPLPVRPPRDRGDLPDIPEFPLLNPIANPEPRNPPLDNPIIPPVKPPLDNPFIPPVQPPLDNPFIPPVQPPLDNPFVPLPPLQNPIMVPDETIRTRMPPDPANSWQWLPDSAGGLPPDAAGAFQGMIRPVHPLSLLAQLDTRQYTTSELGVGGEPNASPIFTQTTVEQTTNQPTDEPTDQTNDQPTEDMPGTPIDQTADGSSQTTPDAHLGVPNCIPCQGEECRCPGPGCEGLPSRDEHTDPPDPPMPSRNQKLFPSFFRGYEAKTQRNLVSGEMKLADDVLHQTNIPVACYGFYEEFDPKYSITDGTDQRCVIGFPYTQAQLQETQSTLGETSFNPDPPNYDPPPEVATVGSTNGWDPIPGGMSFPDKQALADNGGDLTSLFLQPEHKTMTAIWQRMVTEPYALASTQRATDDTVANDTGDTRPLTDWIQRLQQDMVRLISPPVVRLKLPASWLPHLGDSLAGDEGSSTPPSGANGTPDIPTGPYINSPNMIRTYLTSTSDSSSSTSSDNAPGDSGSSDGSDTIDDQSVDMQMGVQDDIPGKYIGLIQKYFALREEVIPVVVPAGAPLEFRAKALQWSFWVKHRMELHLPYPQEAMDLIAKLQEYADQIDRYRALRAELTKTVSQLIGQHVDDTSGIVSWMHQTAENQRVFQQQRAERLAMTPLVEAVQAELTKFSDIVNQPWCRNDLLTTPIYSLDDPWNPARPGLNAAMSCTPQVGTFPILCIPPEKDFVYDLTLFSSRSSPLRIPVLHPVQVFLNLDRLTPPTDLEPAPQDLEDLKLADLPPVPTIDADLLGQIRDVSVASTPPPVHFPEPIDLETPNRSLRYALMILRNRSEAYTHFWTSLEPPVGSTGQDLTDEQTTTDGETSWSTRLSDRLACQKWGEGTCAHVEMDLWERIMRITAIPGVLLDEQLQIQGRHRDVLNPAVAPDAFDLTRTVVCDPVDHVCSPPVRNQVYPPSTGWQVVSPEERTSAQDTLFEQLRTKMRQETFDNNGALKKDPAGLALPYSMTPEQMYPIYHLQKDSDFDLLPPTQ